MRRVRLWLRVAWALLGCFLAGCAHHQVGDTRCGDVGPQVWSGHVWRAVLPEGCPSGTACSQSGGVAACLPVAPISVEVSPAGVRVTRSPLASYPDEPRSAP